MTHHSPTCTGCPHCSAEMRALLSMTPEEQCAWVAADNARRLRTAEDWTPPDIYEPHLKALRDALPSNRWPDAPRPPETPLDANGIPDPYFHALEKLRSANR